MTDRKRLVVWKGGVHLAGTPLWCDAENVRETCFVSSAHVTVARRHRQIIATEATIRLLPSPPLRPSRTTTSTLAVPYGRPFWLGPLRLELFPSGHVFGSASLAVTAGGTRVVYSGAVNPRGGGIAGEADVRVCDALVVDATFGHPRFRFPPTAEVMKALSTWIGHALAEGATPVLLANPLAGAADMVAGLGTHVPFRAHRTIADALRKLRALGAKLPSVRRFEGTPARGEAVLWPITPLFGPRARAIASVRKPRIALVGGWALDPDMLVRVGAHAGFALGAQAGWEALLEYVAQAGAKEIYLTGGGEELARELGARGLAAHLLGPPRQLPLL